jgi:DNA-binding transcriptional LysR family regulator
VVSRDRAVPHVAVRVAGPRFEEVDAELEAVTALREKPAGTIRLTATEKAAASVLWPALERFLPNYPDVKVEIVIDYGLTDIVAERFDADVRFGVTVASGMISVRIAPDARMAVVGSLSFFAECKLPKVPQDLTAHKCINLRLPTHGGLYAWEFEKADREMNVRVGGQLVFGTAALILTAARIAPGNDRPTGRPAAKDFFGLRVATTLGRRECPL